MKSTWKRAFATLLTIAMMATLLVVPAAAAGADDYVLNVSGYQKSDIPKGTTTTVGIYSITNNSDLQDKTGLSDGKSFTKSIKFNSSGYIEFTAPKAGSLLVYGISVADKTGTALKLTNVTTSKDDSKSITDGGTTTSKVTFEGLIKGNKYKLIQGKNEQSVFYVEFIPATAAANERTITFAVAEGITVNTVKVGGTDNAFTATKTGDEGDELFADKSVAVTFKAVSNDAELYTLDTVKLGDEELTAEDGVYTIPASNDSQTITVTAKSSRVAATGVTISDAPTGAMKVGDTAKLTAAMEPEGTTDKVTWKAEPATVATVGDDGTVTAVTIGKATITATAGDVTDTCEVSVVGADQTGPKYTFEAKNMGLDNDVSSETAYDNYFSVLVSTGNVKVNTTGKQTFDGGYESNTRLQLAKAASKTANAVTFTTKKAADVDVWWTAGGGERQVTILGADGTAVDTSKEENVNSESGSTYLSHLALPAAGTYYLGSSANSTVYIFKIEVTEKDAAPETPVITITSPTATQTVALTEGDDLSLAVTASVAPTEGNTLAYKWTKDGAALTGVTAAAYNKNGVDTNDAGTYVCEVSCTGAEPKTATFTVTVAAASVPVEKGDLTAAITTATGVKNGATVKTAEEVKDMAPGAKYFLQDDVDTLAAAITAAETVANNAAATQEQVDAAKNTLNAAVTAFQGKEKTVTVDKTALDAEIAKAPTDAEIAAVETSEDHGATIDNDKTWVTAEVKTALEGAIAAAKTASAKAEATQNEVDKAKADLTAALTNWEPQPGIHVPGHTHDFDSDANPVVVAATCVAKGSTTYTCQAAGCSTPAATKKVDIEIDPTAHDFSVDVPAVAATCGAAGSTAGKKCSRCDATQGVETVAATGAHTYVKGTCSVCGAKDPDYQEPTPPTIVVDQGDASKGQYVLDFNGIAVDTYTGQKNPAGTNNYFTIHYSTASGKGAVEEATDTYTTPEAYNAYHGLNQGGNSNQGTEERVIKFTTTNPGAVVEVWYKTGGTAGTANDARKVFLSTDGKTSLGEGFESPEQDAGTKTLYWKSSPLTAAGTYYLGNTPKPCYFYKVRVTDVAGGVTPATEYTVTANSATASVAKAAEGASVTVTAAAPATGKVFDKWTATGITLTAEQETTNPLTITMPAADVSFTATYKDEGQGTPVDPAKPDKAALNTAVTKAEKDIKGIYVVADDVKVTDVNRGTKFITETDKATYDAAVTAAKAVQANEEATEAEIKAAVDALADAAKLIKTGTKSTGSTNNGATTGRPSNDRTDTSTTTGTQTKADGTVVTTKKDANGTTVTAVAPDGSKTETVTKPNGDVAITATNTDGEVIAKVSLPATIPAPDAKFADVPDNHWAAKSINDMAGLGMVKGVDDANHLFDMDANITRGAVATILFRFSDGKAGMENSFSDVAAGQWFADAVAWASNVGVVTGFENGTFQPDGAITREQLAVMIARYAKIVGLDTTTTGNLTGFTDGMNVQSWAVNGMAWCVDKGIINGRGDGTVDPGTTATRAEAAAMLDRFIELLK